MDSVAISRVIGGALALAALALLSCEDDDSTVAMGAAPQSVSGQSCGAYYSCGCDTRPTNTFTSADNCELTIANIVQVDLDAGEEAGLSYDGTCVAQLLDALEVIGCDSLTSLATDFDKAAALERAGDCKVFYGAQKAGQTCESLDSARRGQLRARPAVPRRRVYRGPGARARGSGV